MDDVDDLSAKVVQRERVEGRELQIIISKRSPRLPSAVKKSVCRDGFWETADAKDSGRTICKSYADTKKRRGG